MIGSEWVTLDNIPVAVRPTEFSVAEYDIACDTIIFWGWSTESLVEYLKPDESYFSAAARMISHEELHRIIYKLEGTDATFMYDNICECDMEGLC